MPRPKCWILENYDYRRCESPEREFTSAVALHTHSYHSEENLGALNALMSKPILRNINEMFRNAFSEKAKEELDYSNLHYCPPISPVEVYELERDAAAELGFGRLLIGITDHDKIAACLELLEARPETADRVAISEELSFYYKCQEFHLGVIGIPAEGADEHHKTLQELAAHGDNRGIFDLLRSLRPQPLVILNHPLYRLRPLADHDQILLSLLNDFVDSIDAIEFNGLRPRAENDAAVDLARRFKLPVVGGGDRHSPLPSLVLSASRRATTIEEYIEEVKAGGGVTICKRDLPPPRLEAFRAHSPIRQALPAHHFLQEAAHHRLSD